MDYQYIVVFNLVNPNMLCPNVCMSLGLGLQKLCIKSLSNSLVSDSRRGAKLTPGPGAKMSADEQALASHDQLPLNLEAAENLLIRRALAETGGNIAEAARRLGVNRTRIYRKLSESNVVS